MSNGASYGVEPVVKEIVTAVWGHGIHLWRAARRHAADRGRSRPSAMRGIARTSSAASLSRRCASCNRRHRPAHMSGSWAGAMGHTQFIPTTYLAYAVDVTGDGGATSGRTTPATVVILGRPRKLSKEIGLASPGLPGGRGDTARRFRHGAGRQGLWRRSVARLAVAGHRQATSRPLPPGRPRPSCWCPEAAPAPLPDHPQLPRHPAPTMPTAMRWRWRIWPTG